MPDVHDDVIQHKAQAAGCILLSTDGPLILASFALFLSFIVYGACIGSLGAALPELSSSFNKSEATIGFAFTTRGIGYLVGTLSCAAIIEIEAIRSRVKLSKEFMVCIATGITGLATGLIAGISDYNGVLFLFFVQGLGFGGVDTLANCVMPELWRSRVQPWMQAMHSCFGLGAVIGPSLVGGFGYRIAFIVLAIVSITPSIALYIYHYIESSKHENEISQEKSANNEYEMVETGSAVVETDVKDASEASNQVVEGESSKVLIENASNKENQIQIEITNNSTDVQADSNTIEDSKPGNADADVDDKKKKPVVLVPWFIRIAITLFFFIYVGSETGFGGWITTFALSNQTDLMRSGGDSQHHHVVSTSRSQSAFLSSIFWAALTGGRILAIPLAIVASTTSMLRVQLTLTLLGALLLLFISNISFSSLIVVAAIYGFALSSIFPLAMTLVGDYGFTMDASTTTMFVLGSTFGEAIIPVVIGHLMHQFSPFALPVVILILAVLLVVLYFTVHLSVVCKCLKYTVKSES